MKEDILNKKKEMMKNKDGFKMIEMVTPVMQDEDP